MKKNQYIFVLMLGLIFSACSKETLNVWEDTTARLGIYFPPATDSVTNYSFVYEPQTVTRETVIVTVYTSGFVSDRDRVIDFEQLAASTEGVIQAIPGIHFMPFDSDEMKQQMVVKAGEVKADIPIILLRDASLKKNEIELRIKIKENSEFKYAVRRDLEKTIRFSNILMQPTAWGKGFAGIFGEYGKVKHRFMIDHSPNEQPIDNAFIESIYGKPGVSDMALMAVYKSYFIVKLTEENDRRNALGKGELREDLHVEGDELGAIVKFGKK